MAKVATQKKFQYLRIMESSFGPDAFTALGHPGRLAVFRLLARRAPAWRPSWRDHRRARPEAEHAVGSSRDAGAGRSRPRPARRQVDLLPPRARRGRRAGGFPGQRLLPRPAGTLCAARGTIPQTPRRRSRPDARSCASTCSSSARATRPGRSLPRRCCEIGEGKFQAFSAGTRPNTELNPFALEVLERNGHDISGLRSKHISEFQQPGATVMDFVFTVCDTAAAEECPPWPGQPITGHWGLPDPVKATGTDAEKALVFAQTYAALRRRIAAFVELPFERARPPVAAARSTTWRARTAERGADRATRGQRLIRMTRIALNGLGRIGKLVLRDLRRARRGGEIVLLNDPVGDAEHARAADGVRHGPWPLADARFPHDARERCRQRRAHPPDA